MKLKVSSLRLNNSSCSRMSRRCTKGWSSCCNIPCLFSGTMHFLNTKTYHASAMIQVSTEFVTFVLYNRLIKLSKKLDTLGQVDVIVLYSVSPLVAVICRDSSCCSMRHLPCSLWAVIGTRWEVYGFVNLRPVSFVSFAFRHYLFTE